MTKDSIVKDYQEGRLPFSELYREATREEQCPDELALRILTRGMAEGGTGRQPTLIDHVHAWLKRRGDLLIPLIGALLLFGAYVAYRAYTSTPADTLQCRGVARDISSR